MKDENKSFFSQSVFTERVRTVMTYKSLTMDDLFKRINGLGYAITKNNLSIYIQRAPNANFLIVLSKALNVPVDYLLGISEELYIEGFDYQYTENRYRKYCGKYSFYFFPTVSSSPKRVEKALLHFDDQCPNQVELVVPVDENSPKTYSGQFLLSSRYSVGYILLKGKGVGECVYLSFLDPVINSNSKVKLLAGAMISVSSGDFKRVPVMSRFVISSQEIPEEKMTNIMANLRLNSKYIMVFDDRLEQSVFDTELTAEMKDDVLERLKNAFAKKECYLIEESYVMNTIKNDCHLSTQQAMSLIDSLRVHSFSDTNNKINRAIDARMFSYIFNSSD